MALESAGAISHEDLGHCGESVGHDEDGHCGDSCPDGGCTRGFFHSCRADAPVVASTIAPHLMGASSDGRAVFAAFGSAGRVLSGFALAPFRPPCA